MRRSNTWKDVQHVLTMARDEDINSSIQCDVSSNKSLIKFWRRRRRRKKKRKRKRKKKN
jgi:hypothetical protein